MTMNAWIPFLNPLAGSCQAALWRASWQGGLALLLVWAVCRVFHRLPARAKSWLWRLAYLKLLVALLFAVPIDLPLLPARSAPPSPPAQFADAIPSLPPPDLPSPAFSVSAQPETTPASPAGAAAPRALPAPSDSVLPARIRPNAAAWLMLVWALGVAAFAVRVWRGSRRSSRLLRGCSPVSEPALLQSCADLARAFRLPATPSLLMSGDISSPLLLGIRRPVIVLPSALVSASSLSNIRLMIAHEMAHRKRFDLGWVWLAVAGESLFFFHPLQWLARREWRLAQEMACDEMVVRMTRVPAAAYGDMLVGVAALNLLNRRKPFLVTLGLTETKEMLARRLNAMKLIKSNSTKRMVLATAAILTVSALSVLPWRLTAQESSPPAQAGPNSQSFARRLIAQESSAPAGGSAGASLSGGGSAGASLSAVVQSASNAPPQGDAAPESPALRQNGPRGGAGGFGGRSTFAAPLSTPPPTNVAPARFEATVYELEIPENRIADLDAAKLESSAATPQSLAGALAAFSVPKVLYKVDQTVNLYGENITLGTQEPTVSGTTMNARGMRVNSIMYQNVGLITRIAAAAPLIAGRNADLKVQLNFQLSVIVPSNVKLSDGVPASSVRTVALSQSGTPKFGKPSILVTVSAAAAGEKSPPVAYIIRYQFTQPKS
jgi:beta-lactamase regulating signal transducer with metallopeptidase domain